MTNAGYQLMKKYTDNVDKVSMLNDHFSSIFTIDNNSVDQMPPLDGSPLPETPPLHINAEGIKPLLNNPNAYRSHSPNNIPDRFLKETSDHIAPVLALIFNASLHQGNSLLIGRILLLPLSLKKDYELILQIIGQFP